jgi:ABC-2 type transport system permease protein
MFSLLIHELRIRVGAMVGWSIGVAGFAIVYLAIYPEVARQLGESAAAAKFFSLYRVVGIEVGSFEAYLASTVVQFVPVLLGIYAILNGTDTLAGEEDRGTLELLIAMPLRRWHIVTAKAMAMLLAALIVLALAGFGAMAMFASLQINTAIGPVDILMAIMSSWPIIVAFMMMSLFLGTWLPTRRFAAMTATIVFVASYFGERFTILAKSLRPVSRWSLFHYLDSTSTLFTEGVKARDVSVLLATGAAFFVLSVVCFVRRDVTTRAWPWRRSFSARRMRTAT